MAGDHDSPKVVRLAILGSLEIKRDGERVPPPDLAAAHHLIALFAVKARYGDQQLVDVLWPSRSLDPDRDETAESVRTNLNTAFSQARRTLGAGAKSGVLKRKQGITHRVSGSGVIVTTDLDEFRQLLQSDDPDDWRAALKLVRGRIAEHVPTRNMRADWIEKEQVQQTKDLETLLSKLDHDAGKDAIAQRATDLLDGRSSVTATASEPVLPQNSQPANIPEPGTSPAVLVPTAAPSNNDDSPAPTKRWPKKRYAIVGLPAALTVLILTVVLTRSTNGAPLPPEGSVVNAETGKVASHVRPEPLRGTVDPLGGGPILVARNTRTEAHYAKWAPVHNTAIERHSAKWSSTHNTRAEVYSPVTPTEVFSIPANVGDVIEFSLMLHNHSSVSIPYMKLTTEWTERLTGELEVHVSILWPVARGKDENAIGGLPSADYRVLPIVYPIHIRLPRTTGPYKLDYVHGSGKLFAGNGDLLGRLPDGITQYGIVLQDVGQPASCFWCASQYVRYVNFDAKVIRK